MMSDIKELIHLRQELSVLAPTSQFKKVGPEEGDFGTLSGLQFDCDQFGGFLYVWSSGRIEFHLVDYRLGSEIIPLTVKTDDTQGVINILLVEIRKITSSS